VVVADFKGNTFATRKYSDVDSFATATHADVADFVDASSSK